MDEFINFKVSLEDILISSENTKDDIIKIMKNIIINIRDALENTTNKIIRKKYFDNLKKHMGDFAGAMFEDEFYEIYNLCVSNNINLKYIRKVFNAFWVFSKIFVTHTIYESIKTKNLVTPIYIKNNVQDICDDVYDNFKKINFTINKELLKCVIKDGISIIFNPFSPDRHISVDHLYLSIIKMPFIGSRYKNNLQRCDKTIGYNKEYMNSVYDIIKSELLESEKNQVVENNLYPWTGLSVYGVKSSCDYYKYCKKNNLYFVSGRSGSSFELFIMYLILFPNIMYDEKSLRALIVFLINFHVVRGTHSVLEVVLAICDVCEYLGKNGTYVCEMLSLYVEDNILRSEGKIISI